MATQRRVAMLGSDRIEDRVDYDPAVELGDAPARRLDGGSASDRAA
jgi:hypothetical protein